MGAIPRFAIAISVTHGLYLQTIGDILMGVGVLGLILWVIVWAPGRRAVAPLTGRRPRWTAAPTRRRRAPGSYARDEVTYEEDYRRQSA